MPVSKEQSTRKNQATTFTCKELTQKWIYSHANGSHLGTFFSGTVFVCFSTRYLQNWCSSDQHTWNRNVPRWVMETHFILGSKGQRSCSHDTLYCTAPLSPCKGRLTSFCYDDGDDDTTSVSLRTQRNIAHAYVSHTGLSQHGFLHSHKCWLLLL